MLPIRTSHGTGYSPSSPTEMQYVLSRARGWLGDLPPLVYCHGSGQNSGSVASGAQQRLFLNTLASEYLVIAADLGNENAWGNDNHRLKITEAINYLDALGADTTRVTLVSVSMGTLGALGWASVNSDRVEAIVSMIPALDLASLHAMVGLDTLINAAYGGSYDEATMGALRSPVRFAPTLLPRSIPIHLFTSTNDTICLPSTADLFMGVRPGTVRTSMGAVGHTGEALGPWADEVLTWLNSIRYGEDAA